MDAPSIQPEAPQAPAMLGGWQTRRERMLSLVRAQRDRLGQLETQILARLENANNAIARERSTLEERLAETDQQRLSIDRREQELSARESELARSLADLDARSKELDQDRQRLRLEQREVEKQRDAQETEIERAESRAGEQLATAKRLRQEVEQKENALVEQSELLASRQKEHARFAAEHERRQFEMSERADELAAATQSFAARQLAAREELAQERAAVEASRQELETALAALRTEQRELKQQRDSREMEFEQNHAGASEQLATIERLRQEVAQQEQALVEQSEQLASWQKDRARYEAEQKRRQSEIEERADELAAADDSLAARRLAVREELAQERAAVEASRQELETAIARFQQEQRGIAAEQIAGAEELKRLQQRATEKLAALDQEQAELAIERERIVTQRSHVADGLRRQRETQNEELSQRLAQIDQRNAQAHSSENALLAEAQSNSAQLGQRLEELREELQSEVAAHEAAQAELTELKSRCEQMRCERENEQRELLDAPSAAALADAAAAAEADRELIETLTTERDELGRRLKQTEEALASAGERADDTSSEDRDREFEDLTQRYEMAVRDIRDLKKQNEALAKNNGAGKPAAVIPGQPLDWEARKRQLLESLEQDENDGNPGHQAERLQIGEVIRHTDAAVRGHQDEIEELKRLLAERPEATEEQLVVAAQLDDLVERDEHVRQHRERLKQLEKEWEDKLRQAEIEISVERAKLARGGAEVEERKRALDELSAHHAGQHGTTDTSGKAKKGGRGRWLSRLGLSDDEK